MLSSLYTSLKRITVGENGSPESESNGIVDDESRQGQTKADIEIPLVANAGITTNRVSTVSQLTSNETEKKDEVEKMHATGTITALDPLMTNGVIDRQYYFNIAKFCSNNSVFQRGCKVEFEAKRTNTTWEVTDMKLYESEIEKTNRERRKYKRVIAQVKSVRRDFIEVESGKDKNNSRTIQIPMQIVKKSNPGIHWMPYDWMQLHLENLWGDDEDTAATDSDLPADITRGKITDIAPLQSKPIIGKVTNRNSNFLIDDSIYFTQDVCKSKKLFPVGTTVKCFAIQSTQQICRDDFVSWRAISVEKSHFLHYTSSDVVMDVDGDESINDDDSRELSSRHENLLCDKEGISISPRVIKFRLTKIGASTSKTILISNTNLHAVRMSKISCHQDTSVCTIDFNIPNKGPDGSVQILSKSQVTLDIVCHPLLIGKTTEVCVFEFDGFDIGRTVSIMGRSDEENLLTVNDVGIERPAFKKQHGEIDLSTIIADKDRRRLRGSQTVRPPFFSQKRLPLFRVPNEMWTVLKNEDENLLRTKYPNALMQLNYENYKQKFMVSLWFEEMENDLRRRLYDLKRVVLTKCGTGYSFRAPGIQEFTPSVNISDAVDVFDAEDPAKSKFQGNIIKIYDQEVTCVFGDAFNEQYTGYPVTVQFCLGRTNYKRCHFAVQTAFDYLGEQFLFPLSDLIVKSSRICVIEDDEIEQDDSVKLQVVSSETMESEKPNIANSAPSIFRKPSHSSSMTMTQSASTVQSSGEVGGRRVSSLRSRFVSNTPSSPSCSSAKLEWFNRNLNEKQRDAVRRVLRGQARPLPYIIYGPPGTGKTVTLVEAVMQVNKLDKNSRVLVCAPSNAAADIIAENLANSNQYHPGDFVRLNGFLRSGQGIAESISPYCTDGDDLANVAMHRLIISTCTTSGQFFSLDLSVGHFTHVFIDEAGYCTEPEAMIPSVLLALTKGGQLILAGDPNQLGPVLMSDVAQNCGLNKSLLERLMTRPLYSRDIDRFPKEKHNPLVVTKLVKNYRAHPSLLKLPSQLFYNDDLVSEASFEEAYSLYQNPSMKDILVTQGVPLIFHGLQGNCSKERDSPSWFNSVEAVQVSDYVTRLKCCGLTNDDIGIITPYRKQVEKIRMALTLTHGLGSEDLPKVASVEEFQGGERKVIIISTVRSANEDRVDKQLERLGFLYQPKRFNVVITRAKALMIIVGNPHVLARNSFWLQLLRYAIELNAYKGCNLPLKLCPEIRKLVSKDELEPLEEKKNPPRSQQ